MSPFWPISHTADVGILVRGDDLSHLFVEATKGLVLLMAEEYTVMPTQWRELEIEAPDREILLVDFLSEIISFAIDSALLVVKVEVTDLIENLGDYQITARIGLIPITKKNPLRNEIKAVTYHNLEIKEISDGLEVSLFMDV